MSIDMNIHMDLLKHLHTIPVLMDLPTCLLTWYTWTVTTWHLHCKFKINV